MKYLTIDGNPVSVFDICQAHEQLEADYNVGGILWERPSNQRRRESTSCQLARLRFNAGHRWVNICEPRNVNDDYSEDDDVRSIYLQNVLRYGLPIDAEMMTFIKAFFTAHFLAQFPQCSQADYKQGR